MSSHSCFPPKILWWSQKQAKRPAISPPLLENHIQIRKTLWTFCSETTTTTTTYWEIRNAHKQLFSWRSFWGFNWKSENIWNGCCPTLSLYPLATSCLLTSSSYWSLHSIPSSMTRISPFILSFSPLLPLLLKLSSGQGKLSVTNRESLLWELKLLHSMNSTQRTCLHLYAVYEVVIAYLPNYFLCTSNKEETQKIVGMCYYANFPVLPSVTPRALCLPLNICNSNLLHFKPWCHNA